MRLPNGVEIPDRIGIDSDLDVTEGRKNDQLFKEIDTLCDDLAEMTFWTHKYGLNADPTCPRCGSEKHYWMKTRRRMDCIDCGKEFTSKSGTIFASSTLNFRQLLKAICLADEPKLTRKRVRNVVGVSESGASPLLARIRLIRATGSILTTPIRAKTK